MLCSALRNEKFVLVLSLELPGSMVGLTFGGGGIGLGSEGAFRTKLRQSLRGYLQPLGKADTVPFALVAGRLKLALCDWFASGRDTR
jgi:hypothetical protein